MGAKRNDIEYQWKLASSLLNEETAGCFLKPSGKNGTYKKSDYVSALTKLNAYKRHGHSLNDTLSAKDIWNALTPSERFRLSFYTPCLARPIDDLNPDEQRDVYTNPDWVFTEKHRGIRVVLIVYAGELNIYSRNYTDDCNLIDYAHRISQRANYDGIYAIDAIMTLTEPFDITDDLNSHGLITNTRPEQMLGLMNMTIPVSLGIQNTAKEKYGADLVTFNLIHPLYLNGVNYMKRPLGDGMDYNVYGDAVRLGQSIGLNVVPVRRSGATTEAEKRVFLKSILDNNGDGVVAQNRKGMYDTTDRRSKSSYIKIKRVTDDRMSDTIDAFLTGMENGTLVLSIYEERNGERFRRPIAKVKPPKGVEVSQLYTGIVLELTGRGISPSGTIVSPKYVKTRPDKSYAECVYTTEFLRSQRNVGFYY